MQAIFIKAHHRFGPYFSHQIVTRLHRLGLQLEDLSSGLSKCSIVRCAMDTATVSLAAWQLLRKCAHPGACMLSVHAHAGLCEGCSRGLVLDPCNARFLGVRQRACCSASEGPAAGHDHHQLVLVVRAQDRDVRRSRQFCTTCDSSRMWPCCLAHQASCRAQPHPE